MDEPLFIGDIVSLCMQGAWYPSGTRSTRENRRLRQRRRRWRWWCCRQQQQQQQCESKELNLGFAIAAVCRWLSMIFTYFCIYIVCCQ